MMEGKEDVMEGEVLWGKGISMELLHKRLGHTSQGEMERLVREQLVRGLEEGIVESTLRKCRLLHLNGYASVTACSCTRIDH